MEAKKLFAVIPRDDCTEENILSIDPSSLFATYDEAEEEMERRYELGFAKWDSLRVLTLWKVGPQKRK